jgi:hypothetical protein
MKVHWLFDTIKQDISDFESVWRDELLVRAPERQNINSLSAGR